MSEKVKRIARLENWHIMKTSSGKSCFIGEVYGHPHCSDGRRVRTSAIVKHEGNKAETMNTIYELGKRNEEFDE